MGIRLRDHQISLVSKLHSTEREALAALVSLQKNDGHFCGELEGDSILQSEYLLMKWALGQESAPMSDGRSGLEILGKIANYLRSQQRPEGGWGQYPRSSDDLSSTVKAYFALKLAGDDPAEPHMIRAVKCVHSMGGAEHCNSFSNFYLAALGQIPWSAVPTIPPEVVWLPKWFFFHLSKVSAWSRTMILPLSIVSVLRPTREISASQGIDELFLNQRERTRLYRRSVGSVFWRAIFGVIDRSLKVAERIGGSPWRKNAIADAFKWIMRRTSQDRPAPTSGLGAIFPPMVYIQIVMKALGIDRDDSRVIRAEKDLDAFFIEDGEMIRIQPCFSPVWDTGIALYAMNDCGLDANDACAARAASWLVRKECVFHGDWAENCPPNTPAGGWYFEYENGWYPDCDDTAMVAMALLRTGGSAAKAAAVRGIDWILAMQNEDGGWAAFDRTCDRPILECVPFADHNAMQDPSCPDITGRVLECLSWYGMRVGDPAIDRAIQYIKSKQEVDGCFFGRWGVNYIYGTWQSIIGPIRCGVSPVEPWILQAGEWIHSIQQESGAFGESADSYIDASLKGKGPPTASQTAWAAMLLQEVFGPHDQGLERAMEWLARTQLSASDAADKARNPDGDPAGSWCETEFTGTGFPRVFYLRYHLYRLYFPLMAIGRFLQARKIQSGAFQNGAVDANASFSPVAGCVNAS
ncbi:MAG: squalene--hopene cyclase [Planctomycetota bacterium]|nr:squalene--hopene cyclase [Planctomycetota bacterium]MDA1262710.1 squalene--hopene cyclase [Planctomycetota bacterium]